MNKEDIVDSIESTKDKVEDKSLREELKNLINKYSLESKKDTPDFMLAKYLSSCLEMLDSMTLDTENGIKKLVK